MSVDFNDNNTIWTSRIKCLSKDDQLKIYKKCKGISIPHREKKGKIEILVSDITPEIEVFIKDIQHKRMYKNNNSKTLVGSTKVYTFMKNEEIPNIFEESNSCVTQVKNGGQVTEEGSKKKYSCNQTFIKKKLKECTKKFANCTRKYIEKSYGNETEECCESDGENRDDEEEDDQVEIEGEDTDNEGTEKDSDNEGTGTGTEEDSSDTENEEEELQDNSIDDSSSFFGTEFDTEVGIKLDHSNFSIQERVIFYKKVLEKSKIEC